MDHKTTEDCILNAGNKNTWNEQEKEGILNNATRKYLRTRTNKKDLAGPILESNGMRVIFQKKGKNNWQFGQECTKFENILKKGSCLHAIITRNKLLEKALPGKEKGLRKNTTLIAANQSVCKMELLWSSSSPLSYESSVSSKCFEWISWFQ